MSSSQSEAARKKIFERLNIDLVGPGTSDETLVLEGQSKPSDVYLTGILWPLGERMGEEDDDGNAGDDEDDPAPSSATVVGQQRPCTMGISFATESDSSEHLIDITIRFGTYHHESERTSEGKLVHHWKRKQHEYNFKKFDLKGKSSASSLIATPGESLKIEMHFRSIISGSCNLSTVTLINRSSCQEPDRVLIEEATLFQTQIEITPHGNTKIISRPSSSKHTDEDERVNFLYRDCHEFSTGHQCSSSWISDGDNAKLIMTEWLPHSFSPAFKEEGDKAFNKLISTGVLSAEYLSSEKSDNALCDNLEELPIAYEQWISSQEEQLISIPDNYKKIALRNIEICKEASSRIRKGINALRESNSLCNAFRLANSAISLQHSWKKDNAGNSLPPLKWRPFQLGFILLSCESACISSSSERGVFDLLWFPTGGGKTEAYLAIIAMNAWYRRLIEDNPDNGAGNSSVMRYTLRLLTAQQFERASSLILACELIRKGLHYTLGKEELGKVPFSIGLWVGGDATPNKYEDAVKGRSSGNSSSAEQISNCPCCFRKTIWTYNDAEQKVTPSCGSEDCTLGLQLGQWPVYTVDSDIYRERPTLVIGTIDKFAQIPFKNEISNLFGFGTRTSTDLIIQDELHLISGPLGTISGIYESAFDWLLIKNKTRAKIIGSTATIRRADQQVRDLFDRDCFQFPPPGLTYENSGFAIIDHEKPWRMYVGVTTAGRSAKFALQAAAGSLLQSGGNSLKVEDSIRDGYATLLCYFNSLRELGGAIVQMLDDVPDSIKLYSARRGEAPRQISLPRELTSRVPQKEIVNILGELRRTVKDIDFVDVVLATNMVSVGVDVPRLGAMLVNGQPKTRSEYIQSTSRVGRSSYPGLVINVLNSSKARDRSHYETFRSWHETIYRDVEATSVTPFASRARDRALHAIIVSMLRHSAQNLHVTPTLARATADEISSVVTEIERRIQSVDPRELAAAQEEIDRLLQEWDDYDPASYIDRYKPASSLMQYAEDYAKKIAAGRTPSSAWPTMNTMRSVEPSSKFRLAEHLSGSFGNYSSRRSDLGSEQASSEAKVPRWRKKNGQ
jgi:hypothetical protein